MTALPPAQPRRRNNPRCRISGLLAVLTARAPAAAEFGERIVLPDQAGKFGERIAGGI
jgi:hypothetical protein